MSEKIKLIDGKLIVPENPVIPFIEGTAPALISGKHLSVFLMQLSGNLIMVRGRLYGRRFLQEKKRINKPETGCLKRLWQVSGNIWLELKDRLPHLSVKECVH